MSAYGDFAAFYDALMQEDYAARADYLLAVFARFGTSPRLLLDLMCGTGSLSVELARRGVEVIGVDGSQDMLAHAGQKAAQAGLAPLFLCQDAQELDLYGTVDSAVCTLDSLNHLTSFGALCRALERVSLFLEPDGLFLFDVNTPYKHREILAGQTFVLETQAVFCVWQNEYEPEHDLIHIALDFFADNGQSYDRYSEEFTERAYTSEELARALKSAGLETLAVFEDLRFSPPEPNCERALYVARKPAASV